MMKNSHYRRDCILFFRWECGVADIVQNRRQKLQTSKRGNEMFLLEMKHKNVDPEFEI